MVTKTEKFIKPAAARRFIEEFIPHDQIFTVKFRRASDGELRTMNCRRGVSQGVVGSGRKPSPNVITVFDLKVNEYRSFRLTSIVEIRGGGLVVRGG